MAGIGSMMKGGAQAPAKQPETGQNPPMEGGDEQQPNVSEEEQQEYEMIVRNALRIISPEGEGEGEPDISPQVLQALKGSDNPTMNLATTAVTLVTSLRDSAKQKGQVLDPDVLFHAGAAIIEALAEVAEAAGIHDYSPEELEQSTYLALDMYRSSAEQTGDVDKEALTQEWGQLVEADKAGKVAEFSPELAERMKGADRG